MLVYALLANGNKEF